MSHEIHGTIVVINGGGDVGSAVAHVLFHHGYIPVVVESAMPSTTRRRMAFAAAVFDGEAELEGVQAERVESLAALRACSDTTECRARRAPRPASGRRRAPSS